jgi:hypothetical protein
MPGTVVRPPFVAFTITPEFTRDKDAIQHFVFHTTEGTGTIESLAHFFQTTLHPSSSGGTYREGIMYITETNGRMGSLGDWTKGVYHVQSHNTECVGVEQIGFHTLDRVGWFKRKKQLWAAAWIAAWNSQELGIPIRRSALNRRWIKPSGFCQHSDVPDNDHVDCGAGYPFEWVLEIAAKWKANGVPVWVKLALPKS